MLKVNEILKATKGRLISGNREISVKGISIDSRTLKPGEAFIAIKGPNFDGHNFIAQALERKASCIIYHSPGYLVRGPAAKGAVFIKVKDTVRALGDIAGFNRRKFDIPVIVVTGSNGKTTTKDMIAAVLSKNFKVLKNAGTKNNHIGLPLTLLALSPAIDTVVLEAGTNHPGEIAYLARIAGPNIAVITNIGPSHLQYFKNLQGVFKEKISLIQHLKEPRIAVLNGDDSLLNKFLKQKAKLPLIFSFGVKNKTDFYAAKIDGLGARLQFLVNRRYKFTLNTPGLYNVYNALAAITVARILGMEYADIIERLCAFTLLQDRLSFVKLNNVQFINDTYNSNPSSLKQALDVLEELKTGGRKIFVMGDMLELGNCDELFHRLAGERAASACDVFITVGPLTKFAADTAKRRGFDTRNIFTCETNREAKDVLFGKISLRPDDIVLVKGSRSMKMEEILDNPGN
ncbi:MAG: hypothetical protein A3K83_05300 [Omnitrophica WOR_2 bacterium RBG_13_44_8b]|nr:MAG: hypothetical protein A3K83_05300 [Omnitrophica WOR_2 bacterium RBG_13_44_8b]